MAYDPSRILAANAVVTLSTAATADQRDAVLAFIRARFREHFDADVDDDSPTLVGAYDAGGELVAAFGLRDGASGFFCEHYLGQPLQDALTQRFGTRVDRAEIIELTHLCAIRPGCLRQLLVLLPGVLLKSGYRYLTCTATACLAAYFRRRGLDATVLAEATAQALPPDQRERWGAYYAAEPRVLVGDIGAALGLPLNLPLAAGG